MKIDLVDEFIKLADYASKKGLFLSKQRLLFFKRRWKELFCRQLKVWGWNGKAQEDLFGFGQYGHNWEKLHPTKKEEKKSAADWLIDFSSELHYCSDRMGLDRLLRCHWRFNQVFMALSEEKL
jgi:hypothetical protein